MSLFGKKPGQEDDRDPFQMERQTNARAALRVLLALYLLPVYYAALVVFVAAEILILAFTVRRWKQGQKKIDRAWEDRAEPEPLQPADDPPEEEP